MSTNFPWVVGLSFFHELTLSGGFLTIFITELVSTMDVDMDPIVVRGRSRGEEVGTSEV